MKPKPPTLADHRRRQNKDGVSVWYVKARGRRRRIELQAYKGRLYLVGCLYAGHEELLRFEETANAICRRLGEITA